MSKQSKAPKQSPVAAAAAALKESLSGDTGKMTPVTGKVTHLKAVPAAGTPGMKAGNEAQGYALAQRAIAEVHSGAKMWNRMVGDLVALAVEARVFFIQAIKQHYTLLNITVKESGIGAAAKRAAASEKTRLSELKACAEALNAGWEFDADSDFHVNVGTARTFLESTGNQSNMAGRGQGKPREGFALNIIKHAMKREAQGDDETKEKAAIIALLKKAYPKQWADAQPQEKAEKQAA